MSEPAAGAGIEAAIETASRFLTFRINQRLYALPASEIAEVIRIPPIARIPQSPKGLLGVANLRGSVLPVASLRGLLGHQESEEQRTERAIVLAGTPVAVAVDSVEALVSLGAERVETGQAELAAEPGELLRGAFQAQAHRDVAKILDIEALLNAAFAQRERRRGVPSAIGRGGSLQQSDEPDNDAQLLVTFEVAGQEYALELDLVQEIVPLPAALTVEPRAEAVVLGVTTFRDSLLPLLSLRGMLGFPLAAAAEARSKVIVTAVAGVTVGLVADRMRSVLSADPRLIEPTPRALAARMGGETAIRAIYRGGGGKRLISLIASEQLFREDVMQRLADQHPAAQSVDSADGTHAERDEARFLVFRLGDEEFGLPIESVDEVARVPREITRVPKTPKFLEGVVNLRGEVLPVVDQRSRFDMPKFAGDPERRRLVVVRTQRHRAGLIVDSVSEVLRTSRQAIEAAPELTDEISRLVDGTINLHAAGRMVLLLAPAELLSRAEHGLLDKFETAGAPAS